MRQPCIPASAIFRFIEETKGYIQWDRFLLDREQGVRSLLRNEKSHAASYEMGYQDGWNASVNALFDFLEGERARIDAEAAAEQPLHGGGGAEGAGEGVGGGNRPAEDSGEGADVPEVRGIGTGQRGDVPVLRRPWDRPRRP